MVFMYDLRFDFESLAIISNQRNFKSAVSALSSTSSAFGTAAASSKFDTSNGIDEQLKAQVLAEEEAAMNQYKVSLILLSFNVLLLIDFFCLFLC